MFTSETFETLRSSVGNLQKTSVEPRTPSKFFGSTLENFGRLQANFGSPSEIVGDVRKFLDAYGRLSKSINFGKLRVNFGKKSNWYSWRVTIWDKLYSSRPIRIILLSVL